MNFFRVRIAPIGCDGPTRPMRQRLSGHGIAEGEYEIERRSVGFRKLLPVFRAQSVCRVFCRRQDIEDIGMARARKVMAARVIPWENQYGIAVGNFASSIRPLLCKSGTEEIGSICLP